MIWSIITYQCRSRRSPSVYSCAVVFILKDMSATILGPFFGKHLIGQHIKPPPLTLVDNKGKWALIHIVLCSFRRHDKRHWVIYGHWIRQLFFRPARHCAPRRCSQRAYLGWFCPLLPMRIHRWLCLYL